MFELYRKYLAIRFVTGFCVTIFISIVMSCQEFKYAVTSSRAEATIFKVYEEPRREGRPRFFVSMYRWHPPGEKDEEGLDVERSDGIREIDAASYKVGDKVQIDYLPRTSRLAGQVQWLWPGILVGSALLALIAASPLLWEAFRGR